MTVQPLDDATLASLLAPWLPQQRWFADKGREVAGVDIARRTMLVEAADVLVEHLLVDVRFADADAVPGRGPRRYQVPLATADALPKDRRAHPLTPVDEDGRPVGDGPVVYDGLRSVRGTQDLVEHLAARDEVGSLRFRLVEGATVETGEPGRLLGGEQSNSSLVYGDDLMVKVFRLVQPGLNPDVELHAALAERECPAVATLRGWVEWDGDEGGGPTTLAMAQEFLAGAADGWAMATASVRDLFAEADLLAEEVGTDFADEARRLGAAVAQVHDDLAAALGTTTRDGTDLVASMRARLDAASHEVPELGRFVDQARGVFDQVAGAGPVPVQRVHGDLHLGQALRAPDRWIVIDFEGEPGAPLDERRTPDCPVRDVAGILRSFDYAAQHTLVGVEDRQRLFRAREWYDRNIDAFCTGYAEVSDTDPRDTGALLRAYTLDKAVYEVVYESRNRPGWIGVPLGAVERILDMA